jgi:hypothetical protein
MRNLGWIRHRNLRTLFMMLETALRNDLIFTLSEKMAHLHQRRSW